MSDDLILAEPGSSGYEQATSPHNSSGRQHPGVVATAHSTADVVAAVRLAEQRGLQVMPQATGHGAGGEVGADTLLLDTSSLTSLSINAAERTAVAGAGSTWGAIQPEAEKSGLLGLAGSSPTVSIAGYTFGGGIGWLSRPHGMAAGKLRRVEYVDGAGNVRQAGDDAADELDREALFAFRGGGGVGIATELEFELVAVPELYAGYLLWPIESLPAVVEAWASTQPDVGDEVATSIGVLHAPPAPPFPESLRGKPIVHLAVASTAGAAGAQPLLDAVRAAGAPAVNTWDRADAAALAGIHLDPPTATPALGIARWLTDAAPSAATDILSVAAPEDADVVMLEIRSIGNDAPAPHGAQARVAGPYVAHAVAPLTAPDARAAIDRAFDRVHAAASPVDAGLSVGSWVEGATSVPDALPDEIRSRVAATADAVDPDHRIRRSRFLA